MGMPPFKCILGFSTSHTSPLTARLEAHASTMDSSYRESYREWGSALSTLHDAVDAALTSDEAAAARHVAEGRACLAACNDALTTFGAALVELRSDLFERGGADSSEPLIAREPYFPTLDYDAVYRLLAGQGAALPNRAFWDEVASRVRDGGARGALRLLDRHVRELQSDLQLFIADAEAAGRLPLRPMADALHDTSLAVSRVMMGYTRLVTTCSYLSILCERASLAYDRALQRAQETLAAS